MAESSRARSLAAQRELPARELRARIADLPATPALKLGAFDLIAEVKLRSPAVGLLKDAAAEDVGGRVASYARAGAAAVSILTEPSRFDGSLGDLAAGARALAPFEVPAMRKDFLVDAYQGSKAAWPVPVACSPSCACCRARSSSSWWTQRSSSACSYCSKHSTRRTSSWRTRWWTPAAVTPGC
jgi:hypothetical protein